MVTINNSDVIKELRIATQLQQGREATPNNLSSQIVPVIEVNPKLLRTCNLVKTNAASGTSALFYTTPTNQDFYIVALEASFIKDAACDLATGVISVNCTIDGAASQSLLKFSVLTLTAQNQTATISFPTPIKVDRNTTISMSRAATTAGLCYMSGTVIGYLVDNISTHWGQKVRWEFGTLIAYNEGNGAVFHRLELVTLTGRVALGIDPIITTSYSLDGVSWSQDRPLRIGAIGNTKKRLAWFQQGNMRQWRIQRFRGDSDSHLSFARLEAQIEGLVN